MPKTQNDNSNQNNFYALVKELLETQTETLKKVSELSTKIDSLTKGRNTEADLAKLWDGV